MHSVQLPRCISLPISSLPSGNPELKGPAPPFASLCTAMTDPQASAGGKEGPPPPAAAPPAKTQQGTEARKKRRRRAAVLLCCLLLLLLLGGGITALLLRECRHTLCWRCTPQPLPQSF